MPIQLGCHGCGKTASVPDVFAGKRVRCKQCGTKIDVPAFVPNDSAVPIRLMDRPKRWSIWKTAKKLGFFNLFPFLILCLCALAFLGLILSGHMGVVEALQLGSALFLGFAVPTAIILTFFSPVILARRGVMSMIRWLILALFFACLSGILFFVAHVVYEGTDPNRRYMVQFTHESLPSDKILLVAFLVLLMTPVCILAAVLYKPRKPTG